MPNNLRPNLATQKWIVKAINRLGYNPYIDTPIHLWTPSQIYRLKQLYKEIAPTCGDRVEAHNTWTKSSLA